MDDQQLDGNSPKYPFDEALKILGSAEGFEGALWDAEMSAPFDAKQQIQGADPSQKYSVFQECMHSLRESLVTQVERWAPKYVDLAAAYPQFANSDSISWTRDQMQKVIDKRLRAPNLDGAVAFVLMTMCGADVKEKRTWSPPEWMCRSVELPLLITQEHKGIVHRLQYALKKALADLRFSQVLKQGFTESADQARKAAEQERVAVTQHIPPTLSPHEEHRTKLPAKKQDLSNYLDSAKLTERQWECASLKWEYGLPVANIARHLGLARKTVDEHIAAAEKKLKEMRVNEKQAKNKAKSGVL